MLSIDINVIPDFLTNIAKMHTQKGHQMYETRLYSVHSIKCMKQDCILFIPVFFPLVLVGLFYRLMRVLPFFFSTLHSKAKEKKWH